jgi:hypothetical protein
MKLDVKAFAVTAGIFWAAAIGLTGIGNLIWCGYGSAFLQIFASLYPGYQATGTVGDLIVGTLYALVDGAVMGLIFVCIYNAFVGNKESTA